MADTRKNSPKPRANGDAWTRITVDRISSSADGRKARPSARVGSKKAAHKGAKSQNRSTGAHAQRATSRNGAHQAPSRSRGAANNVTRKTANAGSAGAKGGKAAAAPKNVIAGAQKAMDNIDSAQVAQALSGAGKSAASAMGTGAKAAGRGIAFIFFGLIDLCKRSKAALAATLVVCALLVGCLVDLGANWGKAYGGVTIGDVDVSGMTRDEMSSALYNRYGTLLESSHITIFANEDARTYINDAIAQAEDRAQAEQLSVEEARLNHQLWTTSAAQLGGSIPYDKLIDQAMAVGRSDGGIGGRFSALMFGKHIDLPLHLDEYQVELLAQDVDMTLGDTRIDADIAISNGYAMAFEGHDGMMVNRTSFANEIASRILDPNDDNTFIASVEVAPSRTTFDQAQAMADAINRTISEGADFVYDSSTWTADATMLGNWLVTTVEPDGNGWKLVAHINQDLAKPEIMKGVLARSNNDPIAIRFDKDSSGNIIVETEDNRIAPDAHTAAADLDEALFGESGKLASGASGSPVRIDVKGTSVEKNMSLDDALASGTVMVVGTYTTEYSTYEGTESRNHNIHLAADFINNSIVRAGGGRWDFNEVAGDCNEQRGFLSAGTIIDGQYVDNIGGGICQVATTVFNAVYESGLDIAERHNHSLYISSYPSGRDAAVSYPDLTLVWENETQSDVLLTTSYTESTLTVTLYSAPTGYTVTSEVGAWEEGEKHNTIKETDSSLAPGQSYVKTTGQDGRSITVIRYVRDEDGVIVKTNFYTSTYAAKDEVVVEGPSTDTEKKNDNGNA